MVASRAIATTTLILVILLAGVGPTGGMPITVIDQQNTAPSTGAFQFSRGPSFGQEFTPTLTGLDAVQLRFSDGSSGNALGANLQVNIRVGSFTGTIIGTSSSISLPDGFAPPFLGSFAQFDFATRVTLVPGNLYVMEVVRLAGTDGDFRIETTGNLYAGGSFVDFNGTRRTATDAAFVEGLVPEPSSVLFVSTGLAALAWRMRRA